MILRNTFKGIFPILLMVLSLSMGCQKDPGYEISWTFEAEGPIYSSPLIQGNYVYCGSDDQRIYALSFTDGREIWAYQTEGFIRSTPAIEGDSLLVNSDDGFLYSLNRENGSLNWKTRLHDATTGRTQWDYYGPSPVVSNGRVYVGGKRGNFYCLNLQDGSLLWEKETSMGFSSIPLIHDDLVYAGCDDKRVYGFNLQTGEMEFEYNTLGVSDIRPAVWENLLICGGKFPMLFAVDMDSQQKKWRFSYEASWVSSSPVIYDDTIYIGSSDITSVFSIDPVTGEEIWKASSGGYAWTIPAVTEDYLFSGVFFPWAQDILRCFDRETGEKLWVFEETDFRALEVTAQQGSNERGTISSPAVMENTLVFGSTSGNIYGLEFQ